MPTQFFPLNYIELLEDGEYYDITVEVGKDPNVKIFCAHMNILYYRSPYLRRTLISIKKSNDAALAHIKLPNILPEIFQIILKYIYGGILSLDDQETSDIFKTLVAADELGLQEIVDYLQKYLTENKSEWMERQFELIHRTSFQSNNLLELQQFCTNLMAKSPGRILKSLDFTSLPEKSLVKLIKRDDLQMEEIEVWNYVLKWGLAQNPTLIPDPGTWSDDDFKVMENTLKQCLTLIRFFSLSSKEFLNKVRPYKKLLNRQIYEGLLRYYLDPDSKPNENISPPRNIKIDETVNSKIANLNIFSTISRWIDKVDFNNEPYLPYKFELLLRGSRDGFTPKDFHELCDDKDNTITFIKIKGTEEIVGGYNPIVWKSSNSWGKTEDSFTFSFKNRSKDPIISNVVRTDCALFFHPKYGPCFGSDLNIYASDESTDYNYIYCLKYNYKKKIRDSDKFSIEDYEIFQIIER